MTVLYLIEANKCLSFSTELHTGPQMMDWLLCIQWENSSHDIYKETKCLYSSSPVGRSQDIYLVSTVPPSMSILGQSMCLSNLLSYLLLCQSRGQLCPDCLAPEEPLTPPARNIAVGQLLYCGLTQRLHSHKCLDGGPTEYFSLGWSCF